ncbi:MAG TPA: penicillin-binding transpeptidase domain-containing protein [Polyangiaceae bacterium]|nr:penicillin-binding transpeptidase domain-containing protein [Polyangiaceae bacterium]
MRPRPLALALASLGLFGLARPLAAAPAPDMRRVRVDRGEVTAPLPGGRGPARLLLDPRLQREAERLLAASRAHEGAVVMADVRSGRLLAWASLGGRDMVSSAVAPSASLFKTVTAAALLESGRVGPATRQCFHGGERAIGEGDLDDDPARDDRCTTFGEALGHSYNLVFARLALKHLRPEALHSMANELGIGSEVPTDVEVPAGEVRVPSDRLGLARASAGFWNARLSPLGALYMMLTVANRGERIRLSLLDEGLPPERRSRGRAMRPSNADHLARMLAVTVRRGTSAKAFRGGDDELSPDDGLWRRVAGKTGTLVGGRPRRMYSWFAGFAPTGRPEVAIAVLLANDERWWTKANVVARDALRAYFREE